jgi:hypothetical protein
MMGVVAVATDMVSDGDEDEDEDEGGGGWAYVVGKRLRPE